MQLVELCETGKTNSQTPFPSVKAPSTVFKLKQTFKTDLSSNSEIRIFFTSSTSTPSLAEEIENKYGSSVAKDLKYPLYRYHLNNTHQPLYRSDPW